MGVGNAMASLVLQFVKIVSDLTRRSSVVEQRDSCADIPGGRKVVGLMHKHIKKSWPSRPKEIRRRRAECKRTGSGRRK